MAYTRLKETKDGKRFYEIAVSRGRGQSRLTKRWYVPDGWSKKAIDRELAKVAAAFEREVQAGEVVSRSEKAAQTAQKAAERAKILTVQEYAERVFLPQKAVTAAEKMVYSYKWTFDKYINPAMGGRKLTEITSAQISAFLLDYQATGAAHASVVRLYAILGSFFKSAFLDETIDRNPMDRVQRPAPRKDELQNQGPEAYTEEELAYILECLKETPLKWRVYISLLCETGLRRGEALALLWSNVDFDRLEITVDGTLVYTPEKGILRTTPKSGKTRTVDITAGTAAMLRQLRAEQAESCVSPYLFTQDGTPNPMHPDSPNRYMRSFGKRYGIDHFHPHKLRHSFASIAITNGADIVSISEILGHADTSITLRTYSHASEESRKRTNAGYHKAIEAARGESKSKSS